MNKEALLEKPARRILITDIAGVLNSSRDRYRIHEFDADKVKRLHNIVSATECEIALAPEMPTDKVLYERMSYARNMLCNLMNAQGFKVYVLDNIFTACINITGAMSDKEYDTTYCVLRAHDNAECEWGCTFGNRLIRPITRTTIDEVVKGAHGIIHIKEEIGLTDNIANRVIEMLNTSVDTDEVPIRIYGKEDVKNILAEKGFLPKSVKQQDKILIKG